jgi:hypothetical protein
VKLSAPGSQTSKIVLEARTALDPRGVLLLAEGARTSKPRGQLLVVSPYLSAATRESLRAQGIGYLDLTGNVWLAIPKPGLFIEAQGAAKDPDRQERLARSLRGAKAGRIVRALIDRKQVPGVRELAAATKVDAGYVSRVTAFLDSQALVTRGERGRLETVDWPALLRRWAQEAPLESRGVTGTFLEPRGLGELMSRLGKSKERYAVTATMAAAAYAPIAPARLAAVWMKDATEAAGRLGLRPADAGANVLLLEPEDDGAFEGAVRREGVWYAAPSQIAADLLTSPGRGPAEGDELIDWMRANEGAWRR